MFYWRSILLKTNKKRLLQKYSKMLRSRLKILLKEPTSYLDI